MGSSSSGRLKKEEDKDEKEKEGGICTLAGGEGNCTSENERAA